MTQDNDDVVTRDNVVTAWREVAACHAAACAARERELGERHGLGISDFEVLERLAESHGPKFCAQDLAEARAPEPERAVPPGRPAGPARPGRACGCDVDRRGIYVVLTAAGEQRHAEAVPVMSLALSDLTDRTTRHYATADRDLISAAAGQIAIAIDNAITAPGRVPDRAGPSSIPLSISWP